ncbi:MAG TPA: DUF4142 domain-containing protein [Chitinophagaceae bacterium]|nr:DUF4142 domain-containing protein [Chitinophagaceae bacterium]
MKNLRNILAGAAIVLAIGACNDSGTGTGSDDTTANANRTDTGTTVGGTNTAVAEKDAQFLMDAAASNMAEIKMGQLAQQKGNAQEVKDIGKMLETDHSAALSDIRNFASARSITLPAEEKPEQKDHYNTLNGKTGKEFDKDWCGHMIEAHEKGIAKFEDAQNNAADAEIKTWAANTLPKLRTHLDRLKECQNKLK